MRCSPCLTLGLAPNLAVGLAVNLVILLTAGAAAAQDPDQREGQKVKPAEVQWPEEEGREQVQQDSARQRNPDLQRNPKKKRQPGQSKQRKNAKQKNKTDPVERVHDADPAPQLVDRSFYQRQEQLHQQTSELARQLEQLRSQVKQRANRSSAPTEEVENLKRRNLELAERIVTLQRQLQEKQRQVDQQRERLAEQENAAAQRKRHEPSQNPETSATISDNVASLAQRVEALERAVKKLSIPVQPRNDPQWAPARRIGPPPPAPANDNRWNGPLSKGSAWHKTHTPQIKSEVSPPFPYRQDPTRSEIGRLPQAKNVNVAPPPPASSVPERRDFVKKSGVGIVEGVVTSLLSDEQKIVLTVSRWHDGKQLRADWVGHQVSIYVDPRLAIQVGDQIALDVRIDAQKGFVWGGEVHRKTAAEPIDAN